MLAASRIAECGYARSCTAAGARWLQPGAAWLSVGLMLSCWVLCHVLALNQRECVLSKQETLPPQLLHTQLDTMHVTGQLVGWVLRRYCSGRQRFVLALGESLAQVADRGFSGATMHKRSVCRLCVDVSCVVVF